MLTWIAVTVLVALMLSSIEDGLQRREQRRGQATVLRARTWLFLLFLGFVLWVTWAFQLLFHAIVG